MWAIADYDYCDMQCVEGLQVTPLIVVAPHTHLMKEGGAGHTLPIMLEPNTIHGLAHPTAGHQCGVEKGLILLITDHALVMTDPLLRVIGAEGVIGLILLITEGVIGPTHTVPGAVTGRIHLTTGVATGHIHHTTGAGTGHIHRATGGATGRIHRSIEAGAVTGQIHLQQIEGGRGIALYLGVYLQGIEVVRGGGLILTIIQRV